MAALLLGLAVAGGTRIGFRDPATWVPLGLLMAGVVGVLVDLRRPSPRSQLARLLFHPLAVNIVYFRLATDVPRLTPFRADDLLLRADRALLGETPAVLFAGLMHPAVTGALALCYVLFYPAFALYQVAWLRDGLESARRFFKGFYVVYGLGLAGYVALPAEGPWLFLASRFDPLTGGPAFALVDFIVRHGSNRVDCFPSLHCAVAIYATAYDALAGRHRRFWLAAGPALGLCVATVALRYHYAVDLLAGAGLALLGLSVARPGRERRVS